MIEQKTIRIWVITPHYNEEYDDLFMEEGDMDELKLIVGKIIDSNIDTKWRRNITIKIESRVWSAAKFDRMLIERVL